MHALRVAIRHEVAAAAANATTTSIDAYPNHARNGNDRETLPQTSLSSHVSSLHEVHVLAPCYATPGLAFLHPGWELDHADAPAATPDDAAHSGPGSTTTSRDHGPRRFRGHFSVEVRAMGLECAPRFPTGPDPQAHAKESPATTAAPTLAPGTAAKEDCTANSDVSTSSDEVVNSRWSDALALRHAWQRDEQANNFLSSSSLPSASALFEEKPFTVALALYADSPFSSEGIITSGYTTSSEATHQVPQLPPVAKLPMWVITWAGPSFRGNGSVADETKAEAHLGNNHHEFDFNARLSRAHTLAEDEGALYERWLKTHFELLNAHFHGHAPTQGSSYLLTWKRRS